MTWNKKHDEFALSVNLSESQAYVLRDILRKGKLNEPTEIEIDLKVTNRWIGEVRPRGEYHRKTITNAIAQLNEKTQGMVVILKRYNPWVYKILVRPLAFVEKIQGTKCASAPKLNRGNPMFSEEHKQRLLKQQQQDISSMDRYFQALDLKFDYSALVKLYRYSGKSLAEVKKAIELLLYRHSKGTEEIGNPYGFIVSCLRNSWQKNFDLVYSPDLPKFDSVRDISRYVREVFTGVKLCPERYLATAKRQAILRVKNGEYILAYVYFEQALFDHPKFKHHLPLNKACGLARGLRDGELTEKNILIEHLKNDF